ncbi:MAG: elongation factor G [Firmicutes bacterium]|nr:elongation factor G [Bacillota bacterium]
MPKSPSAPRVAAIVGPFMSGKTTLMESLLFASGALSRKGSVKEGNSVGDFSPEARARQMSLDADVASMNYLDEAWTLISCPGSVEFLQEMTGALMVADAAIVVVEPDPNRAMMAAPILKFLDDHKVPHLIFVNKMDGAEAAKYLGATVEALQAWSANPLVLRQFPIIEGETLAGYVDLSFERAFRYKAHQESTRIDIPDGLKDEISLARMDMLEKICALDDHLMEMLLEEKLPSMDEVFQVMRGGFQEGKLVPVLFGSAEKDGGVRRILKLLRHEAPEHHVTVKRQELPSDSPMAQVWKTVHAMHIGKQNYVRVWNGEIADGATLGGVRVSGMNKLFGQKQEKITKAVAGEVVALGRMDPIKTGHVLTAQPQPLELPWPAASQPVLPISLKAAKSGEEVKLSSALAKLLEEDLSFILEQNAETQERVLWGQGEIHLKNGVTRLKSKYNVEVASEKPLVPYRETIKKGCEIQGRHKRQTGGHGQFGDVHFRIKPLSRGEGVVFTEEIVGGVVPRNYIPAVEEGVRDYCKQGPLGFPVVDLSVCLFFGSYHDVDSSDMAFKTAARIGMTDGLAKCSPTLLEPILKVQISVPSEHTSKAQRMVTGHRAGQILGFDAKENWPGWDVVDAYLPQSEMNDLIIEIRSQTMGVGFFTWAFDHLSELEGREADKIVEARKKALENHS